MKFWFPLLLILALSAAASAATDIVGPFGPNTSFYGFTGRWPLVGGIGSGGAPVDPCSAGVIDASVGCPLPMLGM
jgi:hypothetical protein